MSLEDEPCDSNQRYSARFYHRLMQSAVREWLKRHGYHSTRRSFDLEMGEQATELLFKDRSKLEVLLNIENICHLYGKRFPKLALLDMVIYYHTNLDSDPVFFLTGGKKLFLGSKFRVSRNEKNIYGKEPIEAGIKKGFSGKFKWGIGKSGKEEKSPPTANLPNEIPKEFEKYGDDLFGHSSFVSIKKRNNPLVEKKDHLSRPKYIPTREKSPSKVVYRRTTSEEPDLSPIGVRKFNQHSWSSQNHASSSFLSEDGKRIASEKE